MFCAAASPDYARLSLDLLLLILLLIVVFLADMTYAWL
jgi:hypothetical protein